jgi:hypothetical protein
MSEPRLDLPRVLEHDGRMNKLSMIPGPKTLSLALVTMLISLSAHADFGVGALGGISTSNPKVSAPGTTASGKTSLVFGAYVETRVVPMLLDLEIDLIRLRREFNTQVGTSSSNTSFQSWQIPALVKFIGFPFLWVGAGPYYALGTGDVKTVSTSPTATSTRENTFTNSGLRRADWGLVGAIGIAAEFIPLVKFGAEFRYVHGLRDVAINSGTTTHMRETQWLARAGMSL